MGREEKENIPGMMEKIRMGHDVDRQRLKLTRALWEAYIIARNLGDKAEILTPLAELAEQAALDEWGEGTTTEVLPNGLRVKKGNMEEIL